MIHQQFVGIDMASQSFVSFVDAQGTAKWANDKREVRAFLKQVPPGAVLGVESTGGYSKLLADMACKAGFTIYMLRPGKVKSFCKSSPVKGKTDRIDAREIAAYLAAFAGRLHPYQPLPAFEDQLRTLARKRSALSDKLASLRKQLSSLGDSKAAVERTLKGLVDRVGQLTAQIEGLLASAEDATVLSSIPCVKTTFIAAVLPALRTIPFASKYSLDSYAGIDLKPNESGRFKGKRSISHEGDRYLRRAVYLAGLSGIRARAWREHYQMLVNEKKLKKVQAINALGRKILHTVYGVYKSQQPFVLQKGVDKQP